MGEATATGGFCAARVKSIVLFLAESREWAENVEKEARLELGLSTDGEWDHELSKDQLAVVRCTKATIAALERELAEITAREARQRGAQE